MFFQNRSAFQISTFGGLYSFLYLWLIAVLLSPSITTAIGPALESRLPLAMEVFLKNPKEQQYELHIHLTNTSQKPLTVDVHDLPWNPPNDSKWLLAHRLDRQTSPLQQRYPRWEIGSHEVKLLPGESIQDKINLNLRLPSLLSDINHYGVQLHWDCPPPSLKFVCKKNAQHSITIPQKDPGKPDVYSINTQACLKLEKTIGLISIPKDDEVLFLYTTERVIANLKHVQSLLYQVDDYVQQCQPTWTNSWAVNFFSEKTFSGFVNDEENEEYFENGLWQQANLGQYSSQVRTLYRFPWIKKKADTVYLSFFH